MNSTKKHWFGATLLIIPAVWFCLPPVPMAAQQRDDAIGAKPQPADVEEFMARKLKSAQRALDAVMTGEFDVVREQAVEMMDLSRHAAWKQLASPTYIQDTADFVASAEFLSRMAESQDAMGVAMGYSKVVQSCANCHQHVRAPRVAMMVPECLTAKHLLASAEY